MFSGSSPPRHSTISACSGWVGAVAAATYCSWPHVPPLDRGLSREWPAPIAVRGHVRNKDDQDTNVIRFRRAAE